MTWHVGRLIDHVHLRAGNFAQSRAFYAAIFDALGLRIEQSGEGWFQMDELFVDAADPTAPATHIHLAFQAKSRAMVDAVYQAAIVAGGRDNGAPGERYYHPSYYACFVLDPDGNNIEAVFHGPVQRSAASVEMNPV